MGAGGDGGRGISALTCFTSSPSTAAWLLPNGTMVPLGSSPPDSNAFISVRQERAIALRRGVDAIPPNGQYCCSSVENETLCVILCEFKLTKCGQVNSLMDGVLRPQHL